MRNDSSLSYDLESLKNAAREVYQHRSNPELIRQRANRNDYVHAGYRILQCVATAIVFGFHLALDKEDHDHDDEDHRDERHHDENQENPHVWDNAFLILYPACFVASFILAVTRIINILPNPRPFIPVAISICGWAAMLSCAIMAMRHAHDEVHVDDMTDAEIAEDPTFLHDLTICAMSLVASSLYLVHAWLCYDCWWWEKKQRKLERGIDAGKNSTSSSNAESISSDTGSSETPPGTSSGTRGERQSESGSRKIRRSSQLLEKLKIRGSKTVQEEDGHHISILEEILQGSVGAKQIKVEDEPVRLYCCCIDFCDMIRREYRTNAPVHEFQVIHVM
ncbi:uncharacterized protein LOC105691806 isoform X1 [Athalia rosae]|uniref:uncharacterized protein LOC105691806 isoform X1 n=1 Tax=Athalia rosae TaxID=37344 RepID=UPI00203416C9|nr:uncharacterized protein LOC105691806 isoform X1 [Athalia rosae]XP_048507974.1 uncharacterized protein LOC105691806 isoform X1 [Athalia rosae]